MSDTIIKLENISKQYRLGQVGTLWLSLSKSTLRGDLQRRRLSWVEAWWHTLRGKEDPTLKIGQTNQLNNQSSINNNQSDYVWALKDIDLEVKQGEILGITGKN
jgi:lipopolysaccharide transport system ATP-binding protein